MPTAQATLISRKCTVESAVRFTRGIRNYLKRPSSLNADGPRSSGVEAGHRGKSGGRCKAITGNARRMYGRNFWPRRHFALAIRSGNNKWERSRLLSRRGREAHPRGFRRTTGDRRWYASAALKIQFKRRVSRRGTSSCRGRLERVNNWPEIEEENESNGVLCAPPPSTRAPRDPY